MAEQKITRGNASHFFVAGELCRRGYSAVVTLGNMPNTDVLCSNLEGTKFVHIQVKTYMAGNGSCSVGRKAEKPFGENFFWVLVGIPEPGCDKDFEYYILPASVISKNVKDTHQFWLNTPGRVGQEHNDSNFRSILLRLSNSPYYWDINEYKNRWDLIEDDY